MDAHTSLKFLLCRSAEYHVCLLIFNPKQGRILWPVRLNAPCCWYMHLSHDLWYKDSDRGRDNPWTAESLYGWLVITLISFYRISKMGGRVFQTFTGMDFLAKCHSLCANQNNGFLKGNWVWSVLYLKVKNETVLSLISLEENLKFALREKTKHISKGNLNL